MSKSRNSEEDEEVIDTVDWLFDWIAVGHALSILILRVNQVRVGHKSAISENTRCSIFLWKFNIL